MDPIENIEAHPSDAPRARRTVVSLGGAAFVFNPWAAGVGAVLTAAALVLFAVGIGASELPMSPIDVVRILCGGGNSFENVVVFDSQLPIGLVSLLVGFALGMSGALTQTVTRNPLATADMLGITSGASAAAVVVITFGSTWASWLADIGLTSAALIGGLGTALMMYVLTWRRGIDPIRLVLVGVAMTAGMQALIAFLLTRAEVTQVAAAQRWIVGSVDGASWSDAVTMFVVLVVAIAVVASQSRNTAVLSLGDDVARGLGVRANAVTGVVLVVAVVIAAVAVSAAGPLAFVALLAPQVAMRLARAEIPGPITSGLMGAVLVTGGEVLCRTVLPAGLPVGVVTAAIGGVALIYLMIQINRKASV
ncbi:FecCD family ABC transporter permease [Gordonia humi]|uniref:Iron complex transport system permease protein n=1 Tax=Gordonia humi TaxID=686429 RepID=A0A840EZ89_9ACTN|nr:iron ABC transporter permease [Gordonia humi]MBB4135096.1 iron complex transport system permease protein [Gordonia humi]